MVRTVEDKLMEITEVYSIEKLLQLVSLEAFFRTQEEFVCEIHDKELRIKFRELLKMITDKKFIELKKEIKE